MHRTARLLRAFDRFQRRLRGRSIVLGIGADRSGHIVDTLVADGWNLRTWREGFESGLDTRRITLRRRWRTVRLEWDNWSEWSLDGPRDIVAEIARGHDMIVTDRTRWSMFDAHRAEAVGDA